MDTSSTASAKTCVLPATKSCSDRQLCEHVAMVLKRHRFEPADATEATRFLVCSTDHGISLRAGAVDGQARIDSAMARPRRVSRRDPLGRAVGRVHGTVVDATAGLGGDTLLLLTMGFRVVACEASPLVYVILQDRLRRSLTAAEQARLTLNCVDGVELLATLKPRPAVVYLDPMFPPRRKRSALPKKELVELRSLAMQADTVDELLSTARRVATDRVVVKRLPASAPLADAPDWELMGKTVRYDVYSSRLR